MNKVKELRAESERIISDIRNAPDYDFRGKEYDKRISSLRRKSLYLYRKLTQDNNRKFKDIESIFVAIEKHYVNSEESEQHTQLSRGDIKG